MRANYELTNFEPTVSVFFSFLQKSPKNSCDSHFNKDATDLCVDTAPFSENN